MALIRAQSYAKLNLSLRVVGRRGDGYHLLDMINAPVNLFDTITLSKKASPGISLTIAGNDQLAREPIESNLAYKVAHELCHRFHIQSGLDITIDKKIPIGGGLGGGSSNAGTVLMLLRTLFELPVTDFDLAQLALPFGSDIPYFLSGGLAQVTGIGETVTQIDCNVGKTVPCLLVFPPVAVSSKHIYSLLREKKGAVEERQVLHHLSLTYSELVTIVQNDLQSVVAEAFPEIAETLRILDEFKYGVSSLTGSGSTVFILPKEINSQTKDLFVDYERKLSKQNLITHLGELLLT